MQKITMPIGLNMTHLEQEIAICHVWNGLIDAGFGVEMWLPTKEAPAGLFDAGETGLTLEGEGYILVMGGMFRLTRKAIARLKEFSESQN